MGTRRRIQFARTAWHLMYDDAVIERAASAFEIHSEVQIASRPGRVDQVLFRRRDRGLDTDGAILRALWPRLGDVTLVDFKGPTREFRRFELVRLMRYAWHYYERHGNKLADARSLTTVLIMPRLNKALHDELADLRCALHDLGDGYAEITGLVYTTYVVFTNQVAEAEDDDFSRIFSHHEVRTLEATRWLRHWLTDEAIMKNADMLEDFDEGIQKLVRAYGWQRILRGFSPEERLAGLASLSPEERMAGLPPEQRLAGLPPEQRLAGLPPEQRLAGLPPEQRLAGLPPEQRLAGLPPEQRLAGLSPEERLAGLSPKQRRQLAAALAKMR